jgi:acetyl esterase/lipase
MPLDPQAQALLEQMAASNMPERDTLTPEEVRANMRAMVGVLGEGEPVARVEDRVIPGPAGPIPARIYTPTGTGPFPVLVYFHGGGWVIGDIETHDGTCRSLCNGAGCIVVSADYRLAPEHRFPAAPEDCYAATVWVARQATTFDGDASRLAVGGDSAGGNLAAVVSLMARDRGGPSLAFQVLIYPATDQRMQAPSIEENGEGYYLTTRDMVWFRGHYLANERDMADPLASPLLAPDLRGLPPALVITAEFDPLRDEGEAYGRKLAEAGVPATISRYDGMIHGFVRMAPVLDQGKVAIGESCRALQAAFARATQPAAEPTR